MKNSIRRVELGLSAMALSVLAMAPQIAGAQATGEPIISLTNANDTFNQGQLSNPRPQYYGFPQFQASNQFAAPFGTETVVNNANASGFEDTGSAAIQVVSIPDAAAAVFNNYLSTLSPNLNVAQIVPYLSGTSSLDISETIQSSGTQQPVRVAAQFEVNASSGSPFYSDGTYTYTASLFSLFQGNLNLGVVSTQSFSASDAASWLDQMSASNSASYDLGINKCAGTQCTAYSLALFGSGGTVSATSSVMPVPEASALGMSVAGMGFVGLVALRRRRSKGG